MYKNEVVFPASNNINDTSLFQIYRTVANHIFNLIPIRLFQTIILDFKDNIKDVFAYRNGKLDNIGEATKLPKPTIIIEFTGNGNNYKDTQFNSVNTPLQNYAGAEGINVEKRGLNAIYSDINNIQIFTSNIYCKSQFNMTIEVQTLDDRNNMANILDTNLKQHYGYQLEKIDTKYLLPNEMVNYLKKCVFAKDLNYIHDNQINLTDNDIMERANDIDNRFTQYLEASSAGVITKFTNKNASIDDLKFSYNRLSNAYYKLDDQIQLSDGEKKGDLYDKFTITASGYIEYYNLMNFVTSVPLTINGEFTDNYLVGSKNADSNYNTRLKVMNTIFTETRDPLFLPVKYKNFALLYEDREFVCENGFDTYPILFKIMEEYKNDTEISPFSFVFFDKFEEINYRNFEDFISNYDFNYYPNDNIPDIDKVIYVIGNIDKTLLKELIKVYVWEGNSLLDESRYYIDDEFNLNVKNTDSNKIYSFKLFVDIIRIKTKFNQLTVYNH